MTYVSYSYDCNMKNHRRLFYFWNFYSLLSIITLMNFYWYFLKEFKIMYTHNASISCLHCLKPIFLNVFFLFLLWILIWNFVLLVFLLTHGIHKVRYIRASNFKIWLTVYGCVWQ